MYNFCYWGEYLSERIDSELRKLRDNQRYIGRIASSTKVYPCGEIRPSIDATIRGYHTFIIQGSHTPLSQSNINDNLMELALYIDAARNADAKYITAVIPCFPYARQERRSGKEDGRREPISASVVSRIIAECGASRIITVDVHAEAIEGFFVGPFDNLWATHILKEDLETRIRIRPETHKTAALDKGGARSASYLANLLGIEPVFVHKERSLDGSVNDAQTKVMGDVDGFSIIVREDMIDTGGTIVKNCSALHKEGAKDIWKLCTRTCIALKNSF